MDEDGEERGVMLRDRKCWRVCLRVCVQHCDAPVLMATEICKWWTSHAWYLINFWVAWQPGGPLSIRVRLAFFHYLSPFLIFCSQGSHNRGLNVFVKVRAAGKPPSCTLWRQSVFTWWWRSWQRKFTKEASLCRHVCPHVHTYTNINTWQIH